MRALVMCRFGGPEVLEWTEVDDLAPGDGEVVVEVEAVTVNRTLDLAVRSGDYTRRPQLPHVLGADPVGRILVVGSGVTGLVPGMRVAVSPVVRPGRPDLPAILLGVDVWGGYAEQVRVPASRVSRVPESLAPVEAAVIARHVPLAIHLLVAKAAVRPGDTVLVMGAAGGLGAAGVQVAKCLGARVIAAAGADSRVAAAVAAGADDGVNYRAEPLDEAVLRLTDGAGVAVVFENVGDPDLFPRALKSLGRGGRLVTAGGHGGGLVPLDITTLYQRQLTILGSTAQTNEDLEQAMALGADGKVRAQIAAVLPMTQAARAHAMVADGEAAGKVVLVPDRLFQGTPAA